MFPVQTLFQTLCCTFLICSFNLQAEERPNIILIMCDDLGWGDVEFNGGRTIKTPHLAEMAANSLKFNRFYAQSPVCSPTRGSVITGRHPYRYGIYSANTGKMRDGEYTLFEALKSKGYATGHFGKWHMGTLTSKIVDANRGRPGQTKHFSPPWQHDVDVCFVTESKVPTFDPMWAPGGKENVGKKNGVRKKASDKGATDKDKTKQKKKPKGDPDFRRKSGNGWYPIEASAEKHFYGTHYWIGQDNFVDPGSKELLGDDTTLIMDRAIPFIESNANSKTPFLAVVWFHAPHLPVVADKDRTGQYPDVKGFPANYYGCVTAIDDQIGRLRKKLRDLKIATNTLVTFCSDNGPEGNASSPGSAGPFSGRKRSLLEGGVRVPSLIEWPGNIRAATETDIPVCTVDYFPTIQAITGFEMPDKRPLDGIDLLPLFKGELKKRGKPLGFISASQAALHEDNYKIYSKNNGKTWSLFDLKQDPAEKNDLAEVHPEIVKSMSQGWNKWRESCKRSDEGKDY